MLVLHYKRLDKLARDKHSSLLGPFISYEENKFCEYDPRVFPRLLLKGIEGFSGKDTFILV
jgi:hypothetical protein